ncbi:hypothetical protein CIB48_g11077 [Xylaria polymorpha]|nr:hypothetical protein CIB48_g11077 [Xylaria polymorpha]
MELFATLNSISTYSSRLTNENEDTSDEQDFGDLFGLISLSLGHSERIRWLLSLDKERCDARLPFVEENMQLYLAINEDFEPIRKIPRQYAITKAYDITEETQYNEYLREDLATKLQVVSAGNLMWVDMALSWAVKTESTTP